MFTSATNIYECTFDRHIQILWGHIKYTSSATVGQRWVRMGMLTPAGVEIADFSAGVKQIAGLERHYVFMQGVTRETAFNDDEINVSIPKDFIIPKTYIFHIEDTANISAADIMSITLQTKVIN